MLNTGGVCRSFDLCTRRSAWFGLQECKHSFEEGREELEGMADVDPQVGVVAAPRPACCGPLRYCSCCMFRCGGGWCAGAKLQGRQ